MNLNRLTVTLFCIVGCVLLFQAGCEEQASNRNVFNDNWLNQPAWDQIRSTPASGPVTDRINTNQMPKISFQKISHDFGKIRPSTANVCDFRFTNTGNANLIISDIKNSCSCTISRLENEKTEYAPGESGRLLAGYTDTELGKIVKHLYVRSNDPTNPEIELSIKAQLVAPISYEPKKLDLALMSNNGNCPAIVVKSLDNRPFSITGFESTSNCIAVNYDPQVKAKQFILEPIVNMDVLELQLDGEFKIQLSHPECEVVKGTFNTPPRFSTSPRIITVNNAHPHKTITKKINVVSNYKEDFDFNTTLSNSNIISVVDTRRTNNGYQLTVDITPPEDNSQNKMFTDTIRLNLAGIGSFEIPCNGYYPGAAHQPYEEECKTCGLKKLDFPKLR